MYIEFRIIFKNNLNGQNIELNIVYNEDLLICLAWTLTKFRTYGSLINSKDVLLGKLKPHLLKATAYLTLDKLLN